MIRKVTLGPRSRVLEAKEAASRELGDRVLGGLLPQGEAETVAYPPTPGPANPTSLRGCACGRVHIPHSDDPDEAVEADGVVHRHSRACYSLNENGGRVYFEKTREPSVLDRIAALEKVVADLMRRLGP